MRSLLVDNHDSYSYNLFHLMAEAFGRPPEVLTNDAPAWRHIDLDDFDAVVISPGPGNPHVSRDVGSALAVLVSSNVPVLGVCLGHQALAHRAGARVSPAPVPRHGHLERVRHDETGLFAGIPQGFTAVRYHSWCVEEPVPPELEVTARADDGVVMAVRHRERPWWGVQFHPESIGTAHGVALMRNFARLAKAVPARRWKLEYRVIDSAIDTEVAFAELFGESRYAFWLDSARVEAGLSRFSFLGEAGETLSSDVDARTVSVRSRSGETREPGSIFDALERRLRERPVSVPDELPFDFTGGYVGYLGYELKAVHGEPNRHVSPWPDAHWMAADRMIAVDHQTNRTWLVAVHDGAALAERAAQAWLGHAWRRLAIAERRTRAGTASSPAGGIAPDRWLDRPRERYTADIEACQRELRRGESYEICLTNTIDVPFRGSPWHLYRRLRKANAAPYAAYLRLGDTFVLCSSPERYLKVDRDRIAESKPIKGTVARSDDPVVDRERRDTLATSAKTRAENLMIVDLLRNDLGRICELGAVGVPKLMNVESYATVHQLVSTIRGRLRDDVSAVSAAKTCFPAGSMTGAPKKRTLEIIDRLEDRARGVYSGAIGFFSLSGAADLNVVIRTAVVHGGRLTVGAGGAIVLDSDTEEEYEEMLLKASSVLNAVRADEVVPPAASVS